MHLKTAGSLSRIPAQDWDALAGENPALRHSYLPALEESGCASAQTGWVMQFLLAYEEERLVGAMPLYFKSHSYGEFVFDWAWADAYERHGLRYYPKLVSSVPFTPITGARALSPSPLVRAALLRAALSMARDGGASSFHCLFPTETEAREMETHGLMLRKAVQFHWQNAGHRDFASFLESMRHEKRKKIRQEREKLQKAGIRCERIEGSRIQEEDWQFFYSCYLQTHQLYQSPIPLTLDFFRQIGRSMPEQILLVVAAKNGRRIAAALDLFASTQLYGRSWGALEYVPGLHFEVCYYQAIEFCLERGLKGFEGGAQGEHKLARGFLPTTTWSAHWLAHPEFSSAVDDFLRQETGAIERYVDELNDSNPFKKR